jgi:transposase
MVHPLTDRRAHVVKTIFTRSVRAGVPAGLEELATLGRTLHRRRDDVLAYFTHRASNGPTEAINGRLEALRRNALGFRNLLNYRLRALLHCAHLAL